MTGGGGFGGSRTPAAPPGCPGAGQERLLPRCLLPLGARLQVQDEQQRAAAGFGPKRQRRNEGALGKTKQTEETASSFLLSPGAIPARLPAPILPVGARHWNLFF